MRVMHDIQQRLCTAYPQGEARAIARMVLEDRFGLTQTDILLDKDNDLSATDLAELEEIVVRLQKKKPVQYVLGCAEFCGHTFHVEPGVLIPRPETEQLVTLVTQEMENRCGSILDMGTGSGCIAISLALALPEAQVKAWDISPDALRIARGNATASGATNVSIEQEDILHPQPSSEMWDAIVSNPPYIRQLEAEEMDSNVLDHEPHLALFVPNEDPLLFYRAIAEYSSTHLREGGLLAVEINQWLSKETAELFSTFGMTDIRIINDIFDNPRFITCRRKK